MLDRVVVSDVFPDEIVRDILDQIVEEATGGGDGEAAARVGWGVRVRPLCFLFHLTE